MLSQHCVQITFIIIKNGPEDKHREAENLDLKSRSHKVLPLNEKSRNGISWLSKKTLILSMLGFSEHTVCDVISEDKVTCRTEWTPSTLSWASLKGDSGSYRKLCHITMEMCLGMLNWKQSRPKEDGIPKAM